MTSTEFAIKFDIDFDLEIPCEDKVHGLRVPGLDEPAAYRVRWNCIDCEHSFIKNICDPDVQDLLKSLVQCDKCKHVMPAKFCMTMITKL